MWYLAIITAIATFTVTNSIVVRQENSLYGPYEAGAPNIAYWDFTGGTHLAQTFVRLTSDEPGKHGGIWNTYPVVSNDWEFHMQFHLHGKGHQSGNGMGIWYTRDILQPGPVFGSRDFFSGLGIFIDTTQDPLNPHKHFHPYISAVVNNGSQPYEHNQDGTVHQVGGCHVTLRNPEWPTKIAVSYISNVLTVFLDVEGKDLWSQCLRSEGVYLPTHYFFGVSASTGPVYSDQHDIIYITALDMNMPEKEWEDRSYITPFAENVLIHPNLDEIQKTIEQLQHIEEQFHHEEKREVKEETKAETAKETKKEPETPKQTEKPKETKKEPEKPKETKKVPEKPKETKREHEELKETTREKEKTIKAKIDKKPASKPATLITKVVYIFGIGVILYVVISVFRKLYLQRQERMHKRLF